MQVGVGVSKKTEKPIKPKKPEKKITEKKNRLNRLIFWKNRPVRFRFYKQKTEKIELNRTEPKPKKTEPNRAKTGKNRAKTEKTEPKPEKPSQTGLNWFLP